MARSDERNKPGTGYFLCRAFSMRGDGVARRCSGAVQATTALTGRTSLMLVLESDIVTMALHSTREWLEGQTPALSLQGLGERMGFPVATALKSEWQFLKCKVPRLDTLRRFATALGVPIEEWVAEKKGAQKESQFHPG